MGGLIAPLPGGRFQRLKLKLIAGILAAGIAVFAAQQPPAPDNTKTNQRDRDANAPTADGAKNNVSDRDMMQQIRKAVMDDQSLSTNAHNVKVIAKHGKVTLKGPVDSEAEKESISRKAADVAGAGNVTNDIQVKTPKVKKSS